MTLWDAENGKLLRVLKDADFERFPGLRAPNENWLAFSPDGKLLAYGAYNTFPFQHREPAGAVLLFEVSSGAPKYRLDGAGPVCFSADGKLLATGSVDNALRLWDVRTGELVRTLARQDHFPPEIAASPDNRTMVSTDGAELRFWNIQTGEPIPVEVRSTMFGARSPQFSPDGKMLAIGGMGGAESRSGWVQLFDTETGGLRRTLDSRSPDVSMLCVAFAPSGAVLAGGMNDGMVDLWDVSSGRKLHSLEGSGGSQRVVFDPAGSTLLVWEGDGPTQFWDVKSGRKLRELKMWR